MTTFGRSAVAEWEGDVAHGSGRVTAGTAAFSAAMTFPRLRGEPAGTTTPEELLAASHAVCFAVALRSVLGQRGGTARRVTVTATITADKGAGAIRIQSSRLEAIVEGLEGVADDRLPEIARTAEEGCTISMLLSRSVTIEREISTR